MAPKIWEPFERAVAWRAFEGSKDSKDKDEVERLCSLFGVSESALRSQARKFGTSEDPDKAFEEALKPFRRRGGPMAYRLIDWALTGAQICEPNKYDTIKRGLESAERQTTPKKRKGGSSSRRDRLAFMEGIFSAEGAPEISGPPGDGNLVSEPTHAWVDNLREAKQWGWVRLFYGLCQHEEDGVRCEHPIPIKVSRVVKWLDQVQKWNSENPEKEPRTIQNREKCRDCYESHLQARNLSNRIYELKQKAKDTVVAAAAEKRKKEKDALKAAEDAAGVRRARMSQQRSQKEEVLRETLSQVEELMKTDPSAAVVLLQSLE